MALIDKTELLRAIEADIDISITGKENAENVKALLQNILNDIKESPVIEAIPKAIIRQRLKKCFSYVNTFGTIH